MTISSTTLELLIKAGLEGEALLAVVRSMEADTQSVPSVAEQRLARKREADRNRIAERRATVALQSGDNPSPLVPPLEVSPAPLPKTPPIIPPTSKISGRARAKSDLPDDFQPNSTTWAVADDCGFTEREVFAEIEMMRDWAKNADGGKGRKSDWDAALRNWLKRKSDERRSKHKTNFQRNNLRDSFAILDAVTDEAIRRAGGHGEESGEENPEFLPGLRQSAA